MDTVKSKKRTDMTPAVIYHLSMQWIKWNSYYEIGTEIRMVAWIQSQTVTLKLAIKDRYASAEEGEPRKTNQSE